MKKSGANTLPRSGNLICSFFVVKQLIAHYNSSNYYSSYRIYQTNNLWNHIVRYYHNLLIGYKPFKGLTKLFT